MNIENNLSPREIPVDWELFRQGSFAFPGITITRDTRAEEIREGIRRETIAGKYWESDGELSGGFALLEEYMVHAGVAVHPMLYFHEDGSLRKFNMMPKGDFGTETSYYRCRDFLRPLIGWGNVARFPWGEVETWLAPDYHDDWHGGDIYITFQK